jgi:hypothetical protein
MKRFHTLLVLGLLAAGANTAWADESWSLNSFKPRVMPVLVHVDAKGKVTDVSPSTELSPRFNRLLLQSLDEMINQPAVVHGRPTDSQFIINLALQVSPRKEGDYYAQFAYVSSSPVPPGSWYWVHVNGHRLALANRNDRWEGPRFDPSRNTYRPASNPNYQRAMNPPAQRASFNASSPAPATQHGK